MTVALLVLVAFVLLVLRIAERAQRVCLDPGADDSDRSPAGRLVQRTCASVRARGAKPPLPEGHRPPSGLGPLSPSERFLRTEAERGIRALQLWLLDQDGAPA